MLGERSGGRWIKAKWRKRNGVGNDQNTLFAHIRMSKNKNNKFIETIVCMYICTLDLMC